MIYCRSRRGRMKIRPAANLTATRRAGAGSAARNGLGPDTERMRA